MGTLPPESDASAGRCQPKIGRGFHDAVTFRRVGLIASSSPLGTNTNAVQHLYVLCEEESRVVVLGDELNVEGLKRGGRGERCVNSGGGRGLLRTTHNTLAFSKRVSYS